MRTSIHHHAPHRLVAIALILGGVAAGCGERSSEQEDALAQLEPLSPADSALLEPAAAALNETAPDSFTVRFSTSAGDFRVRARRDWAPEGADRFYNLVRGGFYDDARFFRVLEGFVAQFGIHADPRVSAAWRQATIPDDPVVETNRRGTLSYAMAGPETRTTQVFINLADNARLDEMGFAPFGEVVEGMEVVERLHAEYGEGAPQGTGPEQARMQTQGNRYLEEEFPELDHVVRAEVVAENGEPVSPEEEEPVSPEDEEPAS